MDKEEQISLVKQWLKECDEKGVKPWEYDFKLESVKKSYKGDSPQFKKETNAIKRIFDWYLDDEITTETETTHLAKAIYCLLWEIEGSTIFGTVKLLDMDVMNSFWTMYSNTIYLKYGVTYTKRKRRKINVSDIDKLKENFGKYKVVNELFEPFAELTHTIGNFVIEHKGFNVGRHNDDFWDLALRFVKAYADIDEKNSWKKKVNKLFFESFVNEDYEIAELYDGHLCPSTKIKPNVQSKESDKQAEQFVHQVCLSIEERGKYMIKKLCENEQIKGIEYSFYSELMRMTVPRFANELWKKDVISNEQRK